MNLILRSTTTFILTFFPLVSFSQSSLEELQQKKEEFNHRIVTLRDSLNLLDKKISYLKMLQDISSKDGEKSNFSKEVEIAKKEESLEASTDVEPNVKSIEAKNDFLLRTQRFGAGKVLRKVEKGTPVQTVDLIGNYYLICVDGECGYANKKYLESHGLTK
ncbi:MAG: hypothetical protein WCD31_13205 [Gillisia sp.]